jgi:methyltransferase (TIGR00027 family)
VPDNAEAPPESLKPDLNAGPSAQRVAIHRAAHQLLDRPKVFDDPLALAILGPEVAAVLKADPRQSETSQASPYLRAYTAARSRLAEDQLGRGVAGGVGQYVLLGAGLDTFAYRSPYAPSVLRVFEVDQPDTQAWKQQRLAQAGITPPPDLSFAPLDFNQRSLVEGLGAAGHDPGRASFFAWLGVTPYLTPEAVCRTLAYLASCPEGSGVVFDYAVSPELLDARGQEVFAAMSGWAREAGEPWLATFDPAALIQELKHLGFGQVEDLGQAEINARYFADRADGLGVGTMYHLISAWV